MIDRSRFTDGPHKPTAWMKRYTEPILALLRDNEDALLIVEDGTRDGFGRYQFSLMKVGHYNGGKCYGLNGSCYCADPEKLVEDWVRFPLSINKSELERMVHRPESWPSVAVAIHRIAETRDRIKADRAAMIEAACEAEETVGIEELEDFAKEERRKANAKATA